MSGEVAGRFGGAEVYAKDVADLIKNDMQPLVGGGLVSRMSKHDTDPFGGDWLGSTVTESRFTIMNALFGISKSSLVCLVSNMNLEHHAARGIDPCPVRKTLDEIRSLDPV